MQAGDEVHIAYPFTVQYEEKGTQNSVKGKKAQNQLIWGDWSKIISIDGSWVNIRSRGRTGWVRIEGLQEDQILEVNFVDIGQGDGCHIQTNKDKSIVIDSGEGDNMYRFLRWRFGKFARKFTFESFLISHPDKDHYKGFEDLLEHEKVHVQNIYHNTIIEQVLGGKPSLGEEVKIGNRKFLTGIVETKQELKAITDDPVKVGRRLFPKLMKTAVDSDRVGNIMGLMASNDIDNPNYYPGYAPSDNQGFTLKIMGPLTQELQDGTKALPKLGNVGETKNGHSVVLILEMGSIKILLGGDLNERSQDYLLEHYTGLDPDPKTPDEMDFLVQEGRKHWEVDLAKACHHGSSHVSSSFLRSTNPLVTVISSGDNEPHSHPRPDTLGMIGKFSRSDRPFIFSTELARSGAENIKHPNKVRAELKKKIDIETKIMHDPDATQVAKNAAKKRLDDHLKIIERSVANYGMINVRTDGERMIVAQRLERERSKSRRWDIYKFEADDRGRVSYRK